MTIELLYGRGTLGVMPPPGCVPTVIGKPSIGGKPYADIDEWEIQMQLRPMRVGRVRLSTDGLSAEETSLTGVDGVTYLASAIAESIARHADPHVAFVPEGPYVVPVHCDGEKPKRSI